MKRSNNRGQKETTLEKLIMWEELQDEAQYTVQLKGRDKYRSTYQVMWEGFTI